jgi:hypothetical protein
VADELEPQAELVGPLRLLDADRDVTFELSTRR